MKEEYQDIIDDYVMGRLPFDEKRKFESRLAEDQELAEQTLFSEQMHQAFVSREEKLAKMRQWRKKPNYVMWVSSIAAIFMIGLFINKLYFVNSEPDLDYMPIPASRAKASSDKSLELIEGKIKEGKYEEALALINEKEQELKEKAPEIPNNASKEEQEEFDYWYKQYKDECDGVKWLRIQCLIGLKRIPEAIVLLDELRQEEGLCQEAAESLYKKIKK